MYYMRQILNISLPKEMVTSVKREVKERGFSSVSEYVRSLIRKKWDEDMWRQIQQSEKEIAEGKGVKLRSLKDLR